MTTTELVINCVVCAFIVGVIVGGVLVDALIVSPARRRAAADRKRLIRAQMNAFRGQQHAGTPYYRARPW